MSKSRLEETQLPFTQRERRGEAAVPVDGPPANRVEQNPQPYLQRVKAGDEKRLGFPDPKELDVSN